MRGVLGVTPGCAEVEEAGVIGREAVRLCEALLFTAVFGEEGDVLQQPILVYVDSPMRIRLREHDQQVATCRLADLNRQPPTVAELYEMERDHMVADQCRHTLPL